MATKKFLRELLDRSADGAYVVDGEQRIVAWNAAAEELLGFEARDVVGAQCYHILGGHTDGGCIVCRRGCQPYNAARKGEQVASFDVQVRTAGGRGRWVNVSVIGLEVEDSENGGALAVVHMMRDNEAKKQALTFASEVSAWARQLHLQNTGPGAEVEDVCVAEQLTAREFQILNLLAQGTDTDGIASQLVIGRTTVRNHIQRILHKLGVHSRLEAVTYARDHHLLD